MLFAWGFFCVALAPVMGFTDVAFMQYSLVADRYQHIAIIGLIALASAVWSRMASKRQRRNTHGGDDRCCCGRRRAYASDFAAKPRYTATP